MDGATSTEGPGTTHFLEDVQIAREAYEKRLTLAERYRNHEGEPASYRSIRIIILTLLLICDKLCPQN